MSNIIDDDLFADRADQLARMEANVFMRQHGVVNRDELTEFLEDATIKGDGQLGAFDVLYGFDSKGRDFAIFKQLDGDGPHVVLREDGRTQ